MGSTDRVLAAMIRCQGVRLGKRLWNLASPMGNVNFSGERRMITGHSSSFQTPMKVKMARVAMTGLETGRITVQ